MTELDPPHEPVQGKDPHGPRPFGERLVAAMRLEPSLYEEVEHDPQALGQATGVVALAGLANGIGSLGMLGTVALVSGLVSSFLGWLVWTSLVWFIGVRLFDHESDFEELLRTLGFVAAPQILYALAILPLGPLRLLLALGVMVATVIAFVRAVRIALDVDTSRAIFVSVLAVVAQLALATIFALLFT